MKDQIINLAAKCGELISTSDAQFGYYAGCCACASSGDEPGTGDDPPFDPGGGTGTGTSGSTTGTGNTQGTAFSTHSRVHMLQFVDQAYKQLGTSVSNTTTDVEQFHGSLATTATSATAALATADLRNFLTNHRVYWNYAQSSY